MNSTQTPETLAADSNLIETVLTVTIKSPNLETRQLEFKLSPECNRLRVGRDPLNEIFIEANRVSRFHASVLLRTDNRLLISDLNSRNGTKLNGKPLDGAAVYELDDNDLLEFGDAEARFNWAQTNSVVNPNDREISLTFPPATQDHDAVPHSAVDETEIPPAPREISADEQKISADKPEQKSASTSVARSAGIVSIAVMGSRVMGLVREQVFAALLGAGDLLDAYLVAFRIPNLLRDLFAEGALSTAFVKTFSEYQVKRSEAEAWRLASLVMNALVVILSAVCLAGVLLAPYIVGVIASGFSETAGKAELAATMTQIMFPFILLVAMAAVAMGVLNTKGVFGIPASASTVFNIVSILVGFSAAYFLSGGKLAQSGDQTAAEWTVIGLSIGTMAGGAAQFLMQFPWLFKAGFRFLPILSFTDAGVRQVFKLMAPAILGTSAVQINVMVNTFFVSDISGAQGWLNCAFRLMQLPIGVFGVAVATASVPTLSKFAAQNDFEKFRQTLGNGIRLVFLLTLPSACGLIVLGEPIIRLIYEHGNFSANATTMTAWALAAYAVGLTGYAAIKVLSPAFYALNDARTPMIISLVSIVVNIVAGFSFRHLLAEVGVSETAPNGLGHVGVALATSCIALINFLALAVLLRRKIKRIEGAKTIKSFIKVAIASVLLSVVSYFSYRFLFGFLGAANLFFQAIEVFVPMALGGAVFLVTAKLLGVAEMNQAVNAFARKLNRGKR